MLPRGVTFAPDVPADTRATPPPRSRLRSAPPPARSTALTHDLDPPLCAQRRPASARLPIPIASTSSTTSLTAPPSRRPRPKSALVTASTNMTSTNTTTTTASTVVTPQDPLALPSRGRLDHLLGAQEEWRRQQNEARVAAEAEAERLRAVECEQEERQEAERQREIRRQRHRMTWKRLWWRTKIQGKLNRDSMGRVVCLTYLTHMMMDDVRCLTPPIPRPTHHPHLIPYMMITIYDPQSIRPRFVSDYGRA